MFLFLTRLGSSETEQVTNKSAAELFPLDQLKMFRGERPPFGALKNTKITLTKKEIDALPSQFSWLEKGIMTSIKDQNMAKCGSCWAFAAVGVFEALIKRSDNIEVDLSEQQLVNCVPEAHGEGCGGLDGYYAHIYMVNNGIVRESVYPYLAEDWECDLTEPSEFYLEKAWNYRADGTETKLDRRQKIKYLIMTYGPVDSVMAVYEDFYYNYTSGVYIYDGTSPMRTYHGVVIAGWVDDNSIPTGGYWIVKNCWGKIWGENGYFRIAYDAQNNNIMEFNIRYSLYDGIGNDPPFFEEMEDEYQGNEGRELIIHTHAIDPDEDALFYDVQTPPRGMNIDSTTGTITWTPDNTQAGDYSIIVTISDSAYTLHKTVTISITNVKKIRY
jgi:C1A family cysteine protease